MKDFINQLSFWLITLSLLFIVCCGMAVLHDNFTDCNVLINSVLISIAGVLLVAVFILILFIIATKTDGYFD